MIGGREMPVYEYECKECEKVLEVQQRMTDAPLLNCPECNAPVKKLMSMSSFQLKGGGWYSDGYASVSKGGDSKSDKPAAPATPAAPPCQTGSACSGCPAAAAS